VCIKVYIYVCIHTKDPTYVQHTYITRASLIEYDRNEVFKG